MTDSVNIATELVALSRYQIHNRSIKDFSLVKKTLSHYDPANVDTVISPNDTMMGDNYIWVGASAAEVIITAVAGSRLVHVEHVLDLPCGYGRVLRHLVKLFPDATFDACDVDVPGVNFCVERFGATPVYSQEDLTCVSFDKKYDLIWIGSLFTHTSADITKRWLSFLVSQLSDDGIVVATFHGRNSINLHKIAPYIDELRWKKIKNQYEEVGYGYQDYTDDERHDFIKGSYGVSVARPHTVIKLLEEIQNTRILFYQERAWANNHDVAVVGRPAWDE